MAPGLSEPRGRRPWSWRRSPGAAGPPPAVTPGPADRVGAVRGRAVFGPLFDHALSPSSARRTGRPARPCVGRRGLAGRVDRPSGPSAPGAGAVVFCRVALSAVSSLPRSGSAASTLDGKGQGRQRARPLPSGSCRPPGRRRAGGRGAGPPATAVRRHRRCSWAWLHGRAGRRLLRWAAHGARHRPPRRRSVLGRFPALAGVDLDVAGARSCCSPNGAGKTTLLRVCAGLVPVVGRGRVLGCDLRRDRRRLRRSASSATPPASTTTSRWPTTCASGPARRRGGPAVRRRRPGPPRPGAGAWRRPRPGACSAGQRRRVALAVLVARRPELWLLDEPHAGLDAAGRDSLDGLVREAAADGAPRSCWPATSGRPVTWPAGTSWSTIAGGVEAGRRRRGTVPAAGRRAAATRRPRWRSSIAGPVPACPERRRRRGGPPMWRDAAWWRQGPARRVRGRVALNQVVPFALLVLCCSPSPSTPTAACSTGRRPACSGSRCCSPRCSPCSAPSRIERPTASATRCGCRASTPPAIFLGKAGGRRGCSCSLLEVLLGAASSCSTTPTSPAGRCWSLTVPGRHRRAGGRR